MSGLHMRAALIIFSLLSAFFFLFEVHTRVDKMSVCWVAVEWIVQLRGIGEHQSAIIKHHQSPVCIKVFV